MYNYIKYKYFRTIWEGGVSMNEMDKEERVRRELIEELKEEGKTDEEIEEIFKAFGV